MEAGFDLDLIALPFNMYEYWKLKTKRLGESE